MDSDESDIRNIKALLTRRGLPPTYKEAYFRRRLTVRMRRRNCDNYKQYLEVLSKDHEEFENLLSDLSINVTRFFRDEESFAWFEKSLEQYIRTKVEQQEKPRFHIWSAGCAMGAEPYTLAIQVEQIKERLEMPTLDVRITASDFNNNLLSIARAGIYHKDVLDEVSPYVLRQYFTPLPDDKFKVKPKLANNIQFANFDLTRDAYPYRRLDVIVCRNVLIYFDVEHQIKIFGHFWHNLLMDGLLFIGRTETLNARYRDLFETLSPRHRVYQKRPEPTHVGGKPKCEFCGEEFTHLVDKIIHERVHAKKITALKDSRNKFQCEHCKKTFLTQTRYEAHLRFFHKEEGY